MLEELKDYEKLRGLLAANPSATAMISYTLFHQQPDPTEPFRLCLVDDTEDPGCVLAVGWGNIFFAKDPDKLDLALEYFDSTAYQELIERTLGDNPGLRAQLLETYRFAGLQQSCCERLP